MKIAVLQFSPSLGMVEQNMLRAQQILEAHPGPMDLLVLPEMAFSGYNFPSRDAIFPFLEPTTAGPTTQWAQKIAQQRQCTVIVGYPEFAKDETTSKTTNYNSTVTVGPDGRILANYRKSFLYYTDETWAEEGFRSQRAGKLFFTGFIPPLGVNIGHGICMDINPYQFTADWAKYEFATSMLTNNVRYVILSMAWLTRLLHEDVVADPNRPDMETVAYWLERFWPFMDSQPREPIVVVFANRCGSEGTQTGMMKLENGNDTPLGDRVSYAGSSCIMRFQSGSVKLWENLASATKEVGLMGKGEEAMLIVDTNIPASFSLQNSKPPMGQAGRR
ncbi:carbon-nitrogen hydrolase [Dissoconium aciculare CBS 342.82]|uniref:Carbon-nitrogen hydrolase n=1 Tax=Dissoconium aciculare CBS 342.82 TaxID=1314786 RepID=A0A6J3M4C4_9PEZI|nr:carbon-nitrogen hydrolase [Dissoconium aciculare CBS 342.82]KAF1822758.1 carbon-nitrogen hydrolase [Dissoconium aciculare CBS 342.82]